MICPKCNKEAHISYKEDVIEEGSVESDGQGGLDFDALERDSDGSTLEITCDECGEQLEYDELVKGLEKDG